MPADTGEAAREVAPAATGSFEQVCTELRDSAHPTPGPGPPERPALLHRYFLIGGPP